MQTTSVDYRVLDIRKFPLCERELRVITGFEAIEPHCSFLLVTDEEPRSLRKEFEGELEGRFIWEAIESGPVEWRILITKTAL